jgi:hypothetical protein
MTPEHPPAIGDTSGDDQSWRAYEMAITLLEHDTQNQWALFATFFVPQAVLLGLALQSLSPDPKKGVFLIGSIAPAFAVGVFGLLICVPTLITHARSNLIARFRIEQAIDLETRVPFKFLEEGGALMRGRNVRGLKLSWYMRRPWNNTFYLRALVGLWALADAGVALSHLPADSFGIMAGTVLVAGLLGINLYFVVDWVFKLGRSA